MALDLAFEAVGDGPPLLILHGLFGSGSNWRRIARELGGSHRVISVDLRNHGASPRADSMNYLQMAGDVRLLIGRLGLSQPSVIGHSMGGKVAMALALMYPHHVDRLVVVDVAPVAYADPERLFLMHNPLAASAHFDWRANLPVIAASIPQLADFPPSLRRQAFERPMHVIAGARSSYVTHGDGDELRAMFPHAQLEVIERAGHWVHADEPQAFVAAARRALQAGPMPTNSNIPMETA